MKKPRGSASPHVTSLTQYLPRGIAGCVETAALQGWGSLWERKMLDVV